MSASDLGADASALLSSLDRVGQKSISRCERRATSGPSAGLDRVAQAVSVACHCVCASARLALPEQCRSMVLTSWVDAASKACASGGMWWLYKPCSDCSAL